MAVFVSVHVRLYKIKYLFCIYTRFVSFFYLILQFTRREMNNIRQKNLI